MPVFIPATIGVLSSISAGTQYNITSRVGSKADSSSYVPHVSYWNGTDSDPMYWHDRAGNSNLNAIRFTGLAIPQGARIDEAYLTIWSYGAYSGLGASDYIYIGTEQVNNAGAITSGSNFTSRNTNVNTEVTWQVPTTTANSADKSPDISSIVQEIVSRGGWSSGNAMMFFTRNNITSGGGPSPQRHSYASTGTSSYWPYLEVTFTA